MNRGGGVRPGGGGVTAPGVAAAITLPWPARNPVPFGALHSASDLLRGALLAEFRRWAKARSDGTVC
jgi:hypothetical protein